MGYRETIASGFMTRNDFNCAETMLQAANQEYRLGLSEDALKVACPFGGGMGKEAACGALTGGLMALGCLFATDRSHRDPRMEAIRDAYVARFVARFGSTDCSVVKARHRDPVTGCEVVVTAAASVLDDIVREKGGPPA